MRILVVHNYLRPPSGENTVFEQEVGLLESRGHEVVTYTKDNRQIDQYGLIQKVGLPINLILSRSSYREVTNIIKKFRPHIAHFHNIFPLISPSVFYAFKTEQTGIVQTLHNFKLVCPKGLLFRNGEICELCSGKNVLPSILYRCYRNSITQTACFTFMLYVHLLMRTWRRCVDAYVVLSPFAKKKYEQRKFPGSRFFVKPNFLQTPPKPSVQDKGYGVFIGRLGEEKGIEYLLDALSRCKRVQMKIFGDGPAKQQLLRKAEDLRLHNVEFMGVIDHQRCMKYLSESRFLVLPSMCYEGMPMVVLEAMAAKKPIVASRLGVLEDMIEHGVSGFLFKPGSVSELAERIGWLSDNVEEASLMGDRARMDFLAKYSAERNYEILMQIYAEAVEIKRRRLVG